MLFNFFNSDGNILHQVLITVSRDPNIVFYTDAHLFFFNINSRFNCEQHSCLDRFRAGTEIMNIDAKVMRYAMIQVFPVGPVFGVFVLYFGFFSAALS